jgi:hypothetical protein
LLRGERQGEQEGEKGEEDHGLQVESWALQVINVS